MKRPYVICHMLSSLDGRIDGEFFGMKALAPIRQDYAKIRADYQCAAVLNGAVTVKEIYADGFIDQLPKSNKHFKREDYKADDSMRRFTIAVDTEGKLKWSKNCVSRNNKQSHIVEVLTENVSDDYLAYLSSLKISYIFAGKESLDVPLMLEKLYSVFGIEKLMICGGGVLNWSFLEADCIDELSLVIAPIVDGETDCATLFDRSSYLNTNVPKALKLAEVRQLEGDGLYLKYQAK